MPKYQMVLGRQNKTNTASSICSPSSIFFFNLKRNPSQLFQLTSWANIFPSLNNILFLLWFLAMGIIYRFPTWELVTQHFFTTNTSSPSNMLQMHTTRVPSSRYFISYVLASKLCWVRHDPIKLYLQLKRWYTMISFNFLHRILSSLEFMIVLLFNLSSVLVLFPVLLIS